MTSFSGADITGANLTGVGIHGVILCNTTMQNGRINNSSCESMVRKHTTERRHCVDTYGAEHPRNTAFKLKWEKHFNYQIQ